MFSIFSIVRNNATYQEQRAREIRRERARFYLNIVFYGGIIVLTIFGVASAVGDSAGMQACMKHQSRATCEHILYR